MENYLRDIQIGTILKVKIINKSSEHYGEICSVLDSHKGRYKLQNSKGEIFCMNKKNHKEHFEVLEVADHIKAAEFRKSKREHSQVKKAWKAYQDLLEKYNQLKYEMSIIEN